MGNKTSRGEKARNHVALSGPSRAQIPNIVITNPTPVVSPSSPKPFDPPSPYNERRYQQQTGHWAPPPTPLGDRGDTTTEESSGETMILAGTPPPDAPPPPPPSDEPTDYSAIFNKYSFPRFNEAATKPITKEVPPIAPPRTNAPAARRNIIYAKDRIAQFEALNTVDRKKENGNANANSPNPYYSVKYARKEKAEPIPVQDFVERTTTATEIASSNKVPIDDYPVYNPVSDFNFRSGTQFQQGAFPIDANRINIGFAGRQGAGKSTLINALRGIALGDPQSAGRNVCDRMEPFRFIEENFKNIVLWEIPYPRTFTSVVDVYDRTMGFDKLYESHKLHLFRHIFVLIPDGALIDDDLTFSRVVHSRRTKITLLSTKTDDDLDAEARETGRNIDDTLRKEYVSRAKSVFGQGFKSRAQVLSNLDLLFISSPVVRNIVSGTTGYLHYQIDEDKLLKKVDLKPGCHYALENKMRKEREEQAALTRPSKLEGQVAIPSPKLPSRPSSASMVPLLSPSIVKSTVLVDAGFEILYGTDDRVFGNMEPQTTVRRAGRTVFNYGFIGGSGVGKSAMINAMRGMSSKHPLAAGRTRAKAGNCERFEFDDDVLKYSVTLWELHYPKKINHYFEFIDKHNIAGYTALFVLIDGVPSDEDLSFSKIAHRRNATLVFLSSKCDKKLASRSRSDEIPVCDLLKQRFVDKGIARFDRVLSSAAPELAGRVHAFFVSAPVFRALRTGDGHYLQFILHERAVFDFLKQKRIIADLLESPNPPAKDGNFLGNDTDTAGVEIREMRTID